MTKFKRVCAWCKKDLGITETEDPSGDDPQELVTHGICEECFEKAMPKKEDETDSQ